MIVGLLEQEKRLAARVIPAIEQATNAQTAPAERAGICPVQAVTSSPCSDASDDCFDCTKKTPTTDGTCHVLSSIAHSKASVSVQQSGGSQSVCSESNASDDATAYDTALIAGIPDKLMLSDQLRKRAGQMDKVRLIPTKCSFGIVTKQTQEWVPLSQVVDFERRNQQADMTLIFVIRRPGCGFCREHGLELTELARQENIAMIGVVKGKSVDDNDLVEFFSAYFRFPIYADEKWKLYKHMGERSLGIMELLRGLLDASARHERKKIISRLSTTDDGFVQGGILGIGKAGELRFAYNENFGSELDIESLRAAIRAVRASQ
jgi:hypothetical protein